MKILCYHGVINNRSKGIENFSKKHVEKKIFIQQIKYLKENANIISIDDVCNNIKNKMKFKKNSVCITFDDGFENNFTVAAPILKKYNIPAIFYLCPDSISRKLFFWVDIIEICIANTKKKSIFIRKNKKNIKYFLTNMQRKKTAILNIKNYCKSITDNKKNLIVNSIIHQSGVNYKKYINKNIYKPASWSQINKCIKSKIFSIGGHSLNHSLLTKKTNLGAQIDILKTINIIKKKTKIRIKYFSYPEGKYNESIIQFMKKNKIVSSPTATSGINSEHTDLFKLKRYMVGFQGIRFPFRHN